MTNNLSESLATAWTPFEWEAIPDHVEDSQFLFMFSPISTPMTPPFERGETVVEKTLRRSFANDVFYTNITGDQEAWLKTTHQEPTLDDLQSALEHLSASYFHNLISLCIADRNQYLPPDYVRPCYLVQQPKNSMTQEQDYPFTATTLQARLQVNMLRAIIDVVCSMLLLVLALALVGITTGVPPGDSPLQSGLIDVITLMYRSSIPEVMKDSPSNVYQLARDVPVR